MKRIKNIHCIALLAGTALLAAGCSKTAGEEVPSGQAGQGQVTVSFTVAAPDAVPVPGTRAVDSGYQLAGQPGENEVNRITVILVGVNGGKELRGEDVVYESQTIDPAHKNDAVHNCTLNMAGTNTTRQHVYIGANLTDAQIAAFAAGNPVAPEAETATGVVDEVMDFDGSDDGSGNGRNIAMFARVKNPAPESGATDPYLFTLTGNDNLNGTGSSAQPIVLERVVSKVLLTFSLETRSYTANAATIDVTDNVVFTRSSYLDSWAVNVAWCTPEDISYAVLPAARMLYLEGSGTPENASESLQLSETGEIVDAIGRNLYFSDPFGAAAGSHHPLGYDETKLKQTSAASASASSHYFQGTYTLENLWTNDIANPSSLGFGKATVDDLVRCLAPSLVIRMKIVPSRLHRYPAEVTNRNNVTTRAAAEGYLGDGTFYLYVGPRHDEDHQGFYTTATYEAAIARDDYRQSDFIRFDKGYCYYRTFINAPARDADGVQTYAGSTGTVVGLKRNTYHIINVPEVVLPGAASLQDFITLKSTVIEWNELGSSDVNVIP